MSSRKAFICAGVWPIASMVSACSAASSRPATELPAWATTGRRCGPGTVLSGPRTVKYVPRWSMVCTLDASAYIGVTGSPTIAVGSQDSHSLPTTSIHSPAIA